MLSKKLVTLPVYLLAQVQFSHPKQTGNHQFPSLHLMYWEQKAGRGQIWVNTVQVRLHVTHALQTTQVGWTSVVLDLIFFPNCRLFSAARRLENKFILQTSISTFFKNLRSATKQQSKNIIFFIEVWMIKLKLSSLHCFKNDRLLCFFKQEQRYSCRKIKTICITLILSLMFGLFSSFWCVTSQTSSSSSQDCFPPNMKKSLTYHLQCVILCSIRKSHVSCSKLYELAPTCLMFQVHVIHISSQRCLMIKVNLILCSVQKNFKYQLQCVCWLHSGYYVYCFLCVLHLKWIS